MKSLSIHPPDQNQRELILHRLDQNLLVEAAAGTGKTTSMTGRMLNLLAEGKCSIETLAAVTFTRKAAGELRSRFQIRLEQAVRTANDDRRKRLSAALANVERCFIGTIHSFCGRLLRERPVEAGVDLDFQELDDQDDVALREQAWRLFVAQLHAQDESLLGELDHLGLELTDLKSAFREFAHYPDVSDWPREPVALPDVQPAVDALRRYAARMAELLPTFPQDVGHDKLMPKYQTICRMMRHTAEQQWTPGRLMEILQEFGKATVVQKMWPGKKEQAVRELKCWDDFRAQTCEPLLAKWYEHRYEPVLRTLLAARRVYDRLRGEARQLNFQDLLLRAADLLRRHPPVRRYFRRRFTHLLVDEFQDTDPIQAEVLLLLAADNPEETDWRKCRPVPGSLFVVGDPKQSIYRFRRADIRIYNEVRGLMEQSGGQVVALTANFRTCGDVLTRVNDHFSTHENDALPAQATLYQAANRPMAVGREEGSAGELSGLYKLLIPDDFSNQGDIAAYEAERIARFIRHALNAGQTVPRSKKELAEGKPAHALPGDFLIVTRNTHRLTVFAEALQRYGIPHQVTGSSTLNQVPELALLHVCLRAVLEPNNPVALLAVLRSPLFGISDVTLYAYHRAGGRFSYNQAVPRIAPTSGRHSENDQAGLADAFRRLKTYSLWLASEPPVSAVERMLADLGLPTRAAGVDGGNERAGSLAKAVELLRAAQAQNWSTRQLADYLQNLVKQEEKFDSLPVNPHQEAPVRVMNLHKVKGLEAPVVFLADPSGENEHDALLHIDRSGERVVGYLAVNGEPDRFGHREHLAVPSGWEGLADKERHFTEAEEVRLRYVAATRAGTMLVISQREKGNQKNPWQYFESDLADAPLLPDPGQVPPPAQKERNLEPHEVKQALAGIEACWQQVLSASYATGRAKEVALGSGEPLRDATGERGAAWGSVIHNLLQQAMLHPQSDLLPLAGQALREEELEPSLAEMAVETVQRVMASAIWRRAQAARRRLVEVPFETLEPGSMPPATRDTVPGSQSGLPTLLRGVMDLIFEEETGWVLVDYKTDAAARTKPKELAEHYRPQLELYAQAWQQATGHKPVELGLFFITTGEYVRL